MSAPDRHYPSRQRSRSRSRRRCRNAWAKALGGLGLAGALVLGPAPIALRLLGLFPENHSPALMPVLLVMNLIILTLLIASNIIASSMIADVVEDSRDHHRTPLRGHVLRRQRLRASACPASASSPRPCCSA
jgi:hypothetical protein